MGKCLGFRCGVGYVEGKNLGWAPHHLLEVQRRYYFGKMSWVESWNSWLLDQATSTIGPQAPHHPHASPMKNFPHETFGFGSWVRRCDKRECISCLGHYQQEIQMS